MQDNENVVIIIATHNNSKTIEKALKSACTCIRPPNKVIIGDNDSTDNTYDILCKILNAKPVTVEDKSGWPPDFTGNYNNISIRIFRKKLSTIGHTLNIAMQMEWQNATIFGFLDATSWYSPDKISQAINIFRTYPVIVGVTSDCDNHYKNGITERVFRPPIDPSIYQFVNDRNFFMRPHILSRLQTGFNEKTDKSIDYEFLTRLCKVGVIYHIPYPLHHNLIVENKT